MPAPFAARVTSKPTLEKRRTCTNCGRLGHLVATCTNPESFHYMIGVEIEGWWFDLISLQEKARQMTGTPGRADGSLHQISRCTGDDEDRDGDLDEDTEDCANGCDDCPHPIERTTPARCNAGKANCKACGARGWEVQSKPGSVGECLKQLTAMYPDVTSRAAGMHIHMSFKEKTSITLLAGEAFFKYWKDRWNEWGKANKVKEGSAFWERLNNQNTYCKVNDPKLWGKKQLISTNARKYDAINFEAYERHGTVEFRMLPMFQKGDLGVQAIENLVDIVETFLQNADIDTAVELKSKLPEKKDEPFMLDPVVDELEIPAALPAVVGEVELSDKVQMGVVKDDKGNPTGVVRIFQYQVDTYMSNAAADAGKKKQQIADPKAHKVQWANFNPLPTGRTT